MTIEEEIEYCYQLFEDEIIEYYYYWDIVLYDAWEEFDEWTRTRRINLSEDNIR